MAAAGKKKVLIAVNSSNKKEKKEVETVTCVMCHFFFIMFLMRDSIKRRDDVFLPAVFAFDLTIHSLTNIMIS